MTDASRKQRLLATLFDATITAALVVFITLASGQFEIAAPYLDGTLVLRACSIVVVSYLLLHLVPLIRSGQTLGKKLFGLQIVRGERAATLPRLLLRAGALLALAFIPVVGLWLQLLHLVDLALVLLPAKQALHDRISGTRVVQLNTAAAST